MSQLRLCMFTQDALFLCTSTYWSDILVGAFVVVLWSRDILSNSLLWTRYTQGGNNPSKIFLVLNHHKVGFTQPGANDTIWLFFFPLTCHRLDSEHEHASKKKANEFG